MAERPLFIKHITQAGAAMRNMFRIAPPSVHRRELFKREAAALVGFVTVFGVGGAAACEPPRDYLREAYQGQTEILEKKGILRAYPLVDLRSTPGFSQQGTIGGGFASVMGEFEGKSVPMLLFAWKTSDEGKDIKISQFPLLKVDPKKGDSGARAMVKFVDFNYKKLVSIKYYNVALKPGQRQFNEQYIVTDSDELDDYVDVAGKMELWLSEEDFNNFKIP